MPKVGDVVVFGGGRGEARVVVQQWSVPDRTAAAVQLDNECVVALAPDGEVLGVLGPMRNYKKWRML